MNKTNRSLLSMRVLHRYIGFFLAGIMAVYAISGILLIFRDTNFLKKEKYVAKHIAPGLTAEKVGKAINKKNLLFSDSTGNVPKFENGSYNTSTGVVEYSVKELPLILNSLTKLHKAKTGQPLYIMNICFGLALLFFVVSAFWMFRPSTRIFKKGIWFTVGGVVLVLIMLFV